MFWNEPASDKAILAKVTQRLARTGLGSRCRLTPTLNRGQVTLSGNIQYEMQRRPAVRAASAVEGVRGVTDHLRLQPRAPQRM